MNGPDDFPDEKRISDLTKIIMVIIGIAIIASIIGGGKYVQTQKENNKREAVEIEKSMEENDFKKVSYILKNKNIDKIQPYTKYRLSLLKSELDQVIKYQDLMTNKNYKQYILDYEPDQLTEEHLYNYALESYQVALTEFFTKSEYKDVLELADKVNFEVFLEPNQYFPGEFENEIQGEINVARCTELYYQDEMKSCIELLKGDKGNVSDKTDDLLKLAYMMVDEETKQDKQSLLFNLVDLEMENKLPSPFKEEFEKLLNTYKDTEEYKHKKEQYIAYENYEPPIIKRPKIGMTQTEVQEIWGKPTKVNRTETRYGISEQWVYYGNKYVYFENGFVIAIRD